MRSQSLFILFATLFGSSLAFTINCNFHMNTFSWLEGEFYTCRRDNLTASTRRDDRYVDGMVGTHMSGKTNDDVRGVHIRGDVVHYFPLKMDHYVPHLTVIAVEYTKMLEIRGSDLAPFPDLEYLYLSYNWIEVIEKDIFASNPKLKGISLEYNRLRFVHEHVMDHLVKGLHFVHFQQAGCADFREDTNMDSAVVRLAEQCGSYDNYVGILVDLYYAQRHHPYV